MKKIAFFVFKGESLCFIHVMLNALEMKEKGYDVKVILEGQAVKLIKEMEEDKSSMFKKVKDMGLFDCVCKACSSKMGVLEYNKDCGIPFNDEMSGHPAMSSYIDEGYEIITM